MYTYWLTLGYALSLVSGTTYGPQVDVTNDVPGKAQVDNLWILEPALLGGGQAMFSLPGTSQ